jgi:hypothetical protein
MPLKPFQQNYWNLSDTVAPPPTPTGRGGYPGFQTSVIASLFGALWDLAVLYMQRARWAVTTFQRLWKLTPEAIDGAIAEAEHPTPPVAPSIEYVRVEVPVEVPVRVEVPVEVRVSEPAPPPEIRYVEVPVPAPAPVARKKAPHVRLGALLAEAGRLRRLDPVSRAVVSRTLDALESPHFAVAQAAVQQTALTDGFTRPDAWRPLSHLLKADQGRAENMYRHLKSREMTRHLVREGGSTLTNPQTGLLVELAYQAYSITGRR